MKSNLSALMGKAALCYGNWFTLAQEHFSVVIAATTLALELFEHTFLFMCMDGEKIVCTVL